MSRSQNIVTEIGMLCCWMHFRISCNLRKVLILMEDHALYQSTGRTWALKLVVVFVALQRSQINAHYYYYDASYSS